MSALTQFSLDLLLCSAHFQVHERPACNMVEDKPILTGISWADQIKLGSGKQEDTPGSSQGTGDDSLPPAKAITVVDMVVVEQIQTSSEVSSITQDLAMEALCQASH